MALQTDQRALEGAEARGKKSQIADAKRQADEAQKKVEAARVKRDALPKFRHVSMERPYTYTEQINHLKATVELGFTIQDTSEAVIVPTVPILETEEKTFTVLENVKPDDTMGVRAQGEVPSETTVPGKSGECRSRSPAHGSQGKGHQPAAADPSDRGP